MLRRPPTVISLKPSDVIEMKDAVEARQAAAEGKGKEMGTLAGSGDAVLEKEQAERSEKEKRSRAERIGA
ncbi:hypothetical protein RQP46_000329 [Phenoliferia psychrophenolica]